ncbi:MAG: hypothetical protein HOP09_17215 [Hyphomicrobium sp.]|nr:hypothetical protein [Hyphomicrobium sp.]
MTSRRLNLPRRAGTTPADAVVWQSRQPERLVGIGFRCCIKGFTTSDATCWREAATAYASALGNDKARALLGDLTQFVLAISATSERAIEVQPPACRGFCRDECLAISIIAAAQHQSREALCASACALLGSDDIGTTLNSAQTFACGLKSVHQVLALESVCPAACAFQLRPQRLV